MSADINGLVEHLFREESGKLAASLTRAFGLSKLDVVEDIVQDSLLSALTDWSFRGVPENPTAWLHRVAKNKAVDLIRRRSMEAREAEAMPGLGGASYTLAFERNFLAGEIEDSQLRMMFACSHPGIPIESQIALVLKTLCGFSVREIASAFLAQEGTIEKRLGRARKYFRDHHVSLEDSLQRHALAERREAVLTSLYLLFNEGYKRTESEGLLDRDLCLEALRLALLLTQNDATCSSDALALVALMSFVVARFDARTNSEGAIILLAEQDRSKWNKELISRGLSYLARSEPDVYSSHYHLEAAIQSLHSTAPSYAETNWAAILGLYKRLYQLKPNAIVGMHMSVAITEVHGPGEAIRMLKAMPLQDHYLYHAILGTAEWKDGRRSDAEKSFRRAIALARNIPERILLEQRLASGNFSLNS